MSASLKRTAADDYLEKPIYDLQVLIKRIQDLIPFGSGEPHAS